MRQSLVLLVVVLFGAGLLLVALTSRPQRNPIASSSGDAAMSDLTGAPAPTIDWDLGPEIFSARAPAVFEADEYEYVADGEAIYTAQETISRTLDVLPSGFTPTQIEARLVTDATLMEQFLGMSSDGYQASMGPAWLVGVIGPGLTDVDVLPPPAYLLNSTPDPPSEIPGASFAWDANSSNETSRGILEESGPRSLAAILALVNADVPIETATEVPFVSNEAPTPTP